jgi:hypothetical protein
MVWLASGVLAAACDESNAGAAADAGAVLGDATVSVLIPDASTPLDAGTAADAVAPGDAHELVDAVTPADAAGDGRIQIGCTVQPADCPDLITPFLNSKACCTPFHACGYLLPEGDEVTRSLFPQIEEFGRMWTMGDPSNRCANSKLFFDVRPGLDEERYLPDDGGQILITPSCMSYTLAAFILPGCCLPDNRCGLSTHMSYDTLSVLNELMPAPFTQPECVTAETLNQQFRATPKLGPFARTVASGTCDYAALDAKLPKPE